MSSENQMQDSLLIRLEKVERENRSLKIGGSIALLGVVGALFLGLSAPPSKTLDAELFIVRDAQGKARMILAVGDEGPALTLLDKDGKLRVNLGVDKDGPALDLFDAAESPRAQLMITEDKGPRLNLYDNKGSQVSLRP
jgi:hypothetical protein